MHQYAYETISLLCEWENCTKLVNNIEEFISHIMNEHLVNLDEVDLHCHWRDCEGFTENLLELRRHILLHAFHTKIKCHGRNIQVRKNIADCTLSIHSRNIIPELPEPLICCWDNCIDEFECAEYFYRHVEYHSDCEAKGENICLWQGCNRNFGNRHKLKEHLRSHTLEKLVACPRCGGMFASRTKFLDHIQRQLPIDENDTDSIYICEYCSRKMSSERLLRDHMRHHVNHYKCPYCDMTCPNRSALSLHISYRHSDDKPHACQYCEYRCKSENDLVKHLESHRETPSFKCPVEGCSYATRSQTCYKVHYTKKHEKKEIKYSCHLCDKVCTRGNYLTKHLLNHHKFRWPSGHCRFRYRLHEDGFYRLQTVRYESLELSQTMMGESAENIDDPNVLLNQIQSSNIDGSNSYCNNQSITDSSTNIVDKRFTSVLPESIQLCQVQLQNPAINDTFSNTAIVKDQEMIEQEPVLINIIDAEDKSSVSGGSVLLIKTSQPVQCDQRSTVQLITKDASGRVQLETAEIITQYEES